MINSLAVKNIMNSSTEYAHLQNLLCYAYSLQVASLRGQEFVMLCILNSGSLVTETGICYVMHTHFR